MLSHGPAEAGTRVSMSWPPDRRTHAMPTAEDGRRHGTRRAKIDGRTPLHSPALSSCGSTLAQVRCTGRSTAASGCPPFPGAGAPGRQGHGDTGHAPLDRASSGL
jgi:hypothetical protein